MKITLAFETKFVVVATDHGLYPNARRYNPAAWEVLDNEAWFRPSEQVEKNLEIAYQEYVSKRPRNDDED